MIDFNNDGKQDVLFRQKYGFADTDHVPLYVLWFDGITLHVDPLPSSVYSVMPAPADDQGESIQVLDFNGDGLDDIAMVNYTNGHNDFGTLHVYLRSRSALHNRMLTQIDRHGTTRNGASIPGEVTYLFYKPIADPAVYLPNYDVCLGLQYPTACMQNKLWVVSDTYRTDDANSTRTAYDHTLYTYGQARRDLRGRGLLGFDWVSANQVDKGVTIKSGYDLQSKEGTLSFYPFAGTPVSVSKSASYVAGDGSTVVLSHTQQNTLTTVHTGTGSFFVYPQSSAESEIETYEDQSTSTLWSKSTTTDVDPNGNLVSSNTTYDDGSTDTLGHVYTYDTSDGTWPQITQDTITETSGTAAVPSLSRQRTLSFDNKWNLHSIASLPAGNDRGEQTLTTTYTPSGEGLPILVTFAESASRGGVTRQVSYTYDPVEKAFPAVETDGLGHIERTAYHPSLGVLLISEDQNGLQTTYGYDGLRRRRSVTRPTGQSSTYSYVSQTGDLYPPASADTLVRTLRQDNDGAVSEVEVNWRGKPTTRRTWDRPDGKAVWETYGYDAFDRLSTYTPPSFAMSGGPAHVLNYDALDRLTTETRADGSQWEYDHSGRQRLLT